MWSDRYYYLNMYKDGSLAGEVPTSELKEFISALPQLEQSGNNEFKNKEPFPFTQLLLLKANNLNSWAEIDTDSKKTNFIAIVCEKGEHIDFEEMISVFVQIASFLNWKLIDEETDDGIENYKIWEPNSNAKDTER